MNTPLYTPTKQGEQTMTKLTCKHQQHHHTCINLHDCHRCHHLTLPPPPNRTRRGNNMNNTTTIQTEVNANLYTIYNNSTNRLNNPHAQDELLTGLIKLYLREHQNFEEIKEITQDITTDCPRTIILHVNNINPKVHKTPTKKIQHKKNHTTLQPNTQQHTNSTHLGYNKRNRTGKG